MTCDTNLKMGVSKTEASKPTETEFAHLLTQDLRFH